VNSIAGLTEEHDVEGLDQADGAIERDGRRAGTLSPRAPRSGPEDLDGPIARLDPEDLRVIVGKAAERYEDVARAVRLAATRGSGNLSPLKAEIDRKLRTRRYLGYWESTVASK